MTIRHIRRVMAGALLTCGLVAAAPIIARAQNTPDLPLEGQRITVVGCLILHTPQGHDDPRLTLAKATVGSVASVPEATCTATDADPMIRLQDMKQAGLDESFAGRWMEIFGRLESQHKVHKVREIHVKSFMPVPVVLPRVAEAVMPAPFVPPAEVAVAPVETVIIAEQPVATAGVRTVLPKTATSLPLFGLIGFASLAAGFGLRLFSRRPEQG